jgi:hypothetical protein
MTVTIEQFTTPASDATLQRVAARLQERNIEALIVEDGEAARKLVLEQLPLGAEVLSGKSKTLQDAGIFDLMQEPGRYDARRPR